MSCPTHRIAQWMDQKLGPAHEGLTIAELRDLMELQLGYWTDAKGVAWSVRLTQRWEAVGKPRRLRLHHGNPQHKPPKSDRRRTGGPSVRVCQQCAVSFPAVRKQKRCDACVAASRGPDGKVRRYRPPAKP